MPELSIVIAAKMLAASKSPMRDTNTKSPENPAKASQIANIDRGQTSIRCLKQPSRCVVLAYLFTTASIFLYSISIQYIYAIPRQPRVQKADIILLAIESFFPASTSHNYSQPLPSVTDNGYSNPPLRHPSRLSVRESQDVELRVPIRKSIYVWRSESRRLHQ